jgi:2-dehydro-3-deoxyphosphogluconate aldolase/(4S)-4-hydroxy-2-oxoglutarate aldolase
MVSKDEVLKHIHETGVIGIFRVDSPDMCFKAMDALKSGGLDVLEVTTTTPNAIEVVREARRKYGDDTVIGLGTVLDVETAEKGIEAGAQLIVSPSLHKDILDICKEHDVVSCPGTFTATEVVEAWKWGADLVKVFPISQVGPSYLKALLGPLPWVRFVPTGGVEVDNAADYIKAGAYCLGVGGGLVSKKAISQGRLDLLIQAARDILKVVRDARRSTANA